MAKARSSYGGLILLVILAVAGGGGWYYWDHRPDNGPEYYTTTVTRGEVVQAVTATGTIKPLQDILVSSQVSGYISKIYADFNDKVKAHQVIATIDPASYQAQVQSAEADLENSKAASALQKVTLDRDQALNQKGLISQSDYDTAAALFAESAAQVRLKEAAVQVARANLSYTTIYAPVDGIVISRNVDVGNTVAASLSAPTLFEIGSDLSHMQIDASVAEADIGNVQVNQEVIFTVDAYPNEEFHGVVYQVRNAPSTQQNVVIYDVMIKVPNEALKLKPGMTANVSIVVSRHPDVLKVANSALRFRLPDGLPSGPLVDLKVPEPGVPTPAPAKPKAKARNPEERRKALQQLLKEAGWSPEGGAPSPATAAQILKMSADRGIDLPEHMQTMLEGIHRSDVPVVRTVYRLPGGNPLGVPEPVRVRVTISDGTNTEVVEGLAAGDTVITGSNILPGPGQAGNSPFGARR